MSVKNSFMMLVVGGLLASCNGGPNKPNIELINDMMKGPDYKAQQYDEHQPHGRSNRVPPEGTVPQGFEPYAYPNDPVAAGKNLKNPLAGKNDPETLARGKKYYSIACQVCHGEKLDGKGTVTSKYPLPIPSLLSDTVRNHPDGRVFHIITKGQGLMGSYSRQITNLDDRLAVVNYIRSIQRQ